MGILYEKVILSQEAKRQIMISKLLTAGVTEYQNKPVDGLGFYELQHVVNITDGV